MFCMKGLNERKGYRGVWVDIFFKVFLIVNLKYNVEKSIIFVSLM